ncbi:hypothetical protein ABEB36_013377 [Hypothenemus hampei]|uniref:Uncharacterized protein n=1 Tax=Hypothenemus hampei TaxID=57062 RepID=A0ABD1EAI4_HYPHA
MLWDAPAINWRIPSLAFRGYDKDDQQNIFLTLNEEIGNIAAVTLHFDNHDMFEVAYAAIEEFAEERVELATPPSSSSPSSSSD